MKTSHAQKIEAALIDVRVPGLTVKELAQKCELSSATIRHIAKWMVQTGQLESGVYPEGVRFCLVPAHLSDPDMVAWL